MKECVRHRRKICNIRFC